MDRGKYPCALKITGRFLHPQVSILSLPPARGRYRSAFRPSSPVIPRMSHKWNHTTCSFPRLASCTPHAASEFRPTWCEISGLFLVIAAESSTVFVGSPVDRLPSCFQFGGVMGGRGRSVQVLVWTCGSISPGRVPRHGIAG